MFPESKIASLPTENHELLERIVFSCGSWKGSGVGSLQGEVTRTRCIALIITLKLTLRPRVLYLEGPQRLFSSLSWRWGQLLRISRLPWCSERWWHVSDVLFSEERANSTKGRGRRESLVSDLGPALDGCVASGELLNLSGLWGSNAPRDERCPADCVVCNWPAQ